MNTRIAIALLCVGALAFATGTRSHSSEPPAARSERVSAPDTPLASSMRLTVDEGVDFSLHLTNGSSRKLELRFPSGQTHDFVVLDSIGREVWRWSEGRLFTQTLQTKSVGRGETISYSDRWEPKGQRGTFTAVGTLRSSTHPVESRVEFELR
jgi:hypothetical protein